jgi:hypothetical protein
VQCDETTPRARPPHRPSPRSSLHLVASTYWLAVTVPVLDSSGMGAFGRGATERDAFDERSAARPSLGLGNV